MSASPWSLQHCSQQPRQHNNLSVHQQIKKMWYTHTHTDIYIYTYTNTYTHIHTRIHTQTHTYTHMCTHLCAHTHTPSVIKKRRKSSTCDKTDEIRGHYAKWGQSKKQIQHAAPFTGGTWTITEAQSRLAVTPGLAEEKMGRRQLKGVN